MSEVHYETLGFYIELDCLIDVKLGMIKNHSEDLFYEQFISKKYFNRIQDDFYPGFKEEYSNRSNKQLFDGIITEMSPLIKEFVLNAEVNSKISPTLQKPVITLNTYPYVIEDPEFIIKALRYITSDKSDIEIIYLTKEELTPSHVKNKYSVVTMYDPWEWLEIHSVNDNLRKVTCPEVTMFSPRIFFSTPPSGTPREYNQLFIDAEKATEMFISLKLLPVHVFSAETAVTVWKRP